jgi:hypothetical protein
LFSGEVIDIKWEQQVTTGTATSYGLELLLQKHKGRFNGWVGYTLSKTDWLFPEINAGRPYPARYDRRHDLSIVTFYDLRKASEKKSAIKLSTVFVYGTGNAVTLPQATFDAPYVSPEPVEAFFGFFNYSLTDYGPMNSYRMPAYHRLDFSLQFIKPQKWGERVIEFSVYNAYNRANPWFLDRGFRDGRTVLVQYSLFGIVPSINYIARF